MINNETVGVGIVTFKRPKGLEKLLGSLKACEGTIDQFVVVDDSGEENESGLTAFTSLSADDSTFIKNGGNFGVGISKNKCLTYLLAKGIEHFFLIEDDIFVKNPAVFEEYIECSKKTGIQHFNFSQHGLCNKFPYSDIPNPRSFVQYDEQRLVPFYAACVGAFSYYSKKALEVAGLMNERFYNACEHVEHTHRIHLAGMHPPYWWYPDIPNSHEYLGDEPWSINQSNISSRPDATNLCREADEIFKELYGCNPRQMPDTPVEEVTKQLKLIKQMYGR